MTFDEWWGDPDEESTCHRRAALDAWEFNGAQRAAAATAAERERCRLIAFNKAIEQAALTSWANHCTLMLLAVEKAIGEETDDEV